MKFRIALISAAVFMSACGGSGGDPAAADEPVPILAEGLYLGLGGEDVAFTQTPRRFLQIVLEDGESWILDRNADGSPRFFATGKFTYSDRAPVTARTDIGSTIQAELNRFESIGALVAVNGANLSPSPVVTAQSANPSFSVVLHPAANSVLRSLAQPGDDTIINTNIGVKEIAFNYDTPASLARAAGDWYVLQSLCPTPVLLNVSAAGLLSGNDPVSGCSVSGNIAPRPSGTNVFNASISLSNCPAAGQFSGIAYIFNDYTGRVIVPHILLQGINADRSRVASLMFRKQEIRPPEDSTCKL